MSQNKSCLTCGWYVSKNCSKGMEAKKFCLGNSEYELWEPLSEDIKKERQQELERAQEKEVLEDFQEEENYTENQDEGDTLEETPEDLQQSKEGLMQMGLDEAQADSILNSVKVAQDEKTFEGYNGVRKPQQQIIVSDTCEGCKNDSTFVGCFINKYSECVSSGRYLYQHEEGLEGTTTGLEGKEDEDLKTRIKKQISLDDILGE